MEKMYYVNNKNSNLIFFYFKGKKIIFKIIEYKENKLKNNFKFTCPFKKCLKGYSHKNKMLAHLRTHYGIKPFVCSFCGKNFNEKGNLKTHLRIHTGERPFKCEKCQKSFKALGQLKEHITSHTGIKPFQCPICLKYYRRKGILKNHIFIHHSNKKSFPCAYCDKKFSDNFRLDKHISSHFFKNDNYLINDSVSQISTYQNENKGYNKERKSSLNCNEIFELLEKDLNNHNLNYNYYSYGNKFNDENDLFEMEIGNFFSC